MLDTKAYLEIQFKGYPVGKKIRCHIWVQGVISKEQLESDLKKYLSLHGEYKDEIIHKIKVFNCYSTNNKKDNENYLDLIVNSTLDAINLKAFNEMKPKKEKDNGFSAKTINLTDMKDDDVVKLHERLEEEILRRRYSLTVEEFKFFKENKDEIDISYTKEFYEKCGGDIIKLKKQKIREKINSL